MIEFKNLMVEVEDKLIINKFNLEVLPGELHVIMGPNGSGKSTLANAIAGHPKYSIKGGSITYNKKVINEFSPEERSSLGIFLSMQYPISIPGVKNIYFLKAAVNSIRKTKKQSEIDTAEFLKIWLKFSNVISFQSFFFIQKLNSDIPFLVLFLDDHNLTL